MSERTHHQLRSPESDPKSSGGSAPGEKTGLFHAPPKPGALDSMQTGQIEPISPTQDPSVGLLETLQAVKDKQQGGSSPAHEVSDISGVQTQKSTLDRLMNAQSAVFGGATLILVLSVWGLIHLADQATKNIGQTERPGESSATSVRTAEQPATPAAIQPPPPVTQAPSQPPKPTLKVPPAAPAQTPGAIKQQNAAAIQAEKERLAREEQERAQREREREEEEKRERERQLRELEGGADQQEGQPPQNSEVPPPPNPDAIPPPNPENG